MKCINNFWSISISLIACLLLCGCGNFGIDIPYDVNTNITAYQNSSKDSVNYLDSFAKNICVVDEDVNTSSCDLSLATAGGLFNKTTGETLYSKQANTRLHPASLTKVMTALVALKYGKLDDIITASSNVKINESGAQMCGFREGDKATLEQVLNALLIYSGNDAGVMIAEYVSGSEEAFTNLMNEEAKRIGATNTYFENSHGLTSDNHLTTAYDLYLIFNEALKYDKFREIINSKTYQSSFSTADGGTKKMDYENTNRYINGGIKVPDNTTVIGGKTGTTKAAGSCLILYSRSKSSGDEYISVVLDSESSDSLYENMSSLLLLEN